MRIKIIESIKLPMNGFRIFITIILFLSLLRNPIDSKENERILIKASVIEFEKREEREYSMDGGGCDLLLHVKAMVLILETNPRKILRKKMTIKKSYVYDSKEIRILYKMEKGSIIQFSSFDPVNPDGEIEVHEFLSIENPK
ncbi:MAG TPA: hypothetical protein PK079_25365 [Leptospiraceae bacterium]|nr:hypothetical protein [Leptospiraceae bacterium]HMW07314.1 hypothetical protein [Leptospiraceae bacterium]HMX34048.1 hypothetical protein [Leptospiraceae bacterium]HMY32978.1 hypothetical protein [Leptospiraceae bacterium]HMZ67460.1 hypothetical protein [Leptospiraceae bacterium]